MPSDILQTSLREIQLDESRRIGIAYEKAKRDKTHEGLVIITATLAPWLLRLPAYARKGTARAKFAKIVCAAKAVNTCCLLTLRSTSRPACMLVFTS